MKKYLLGIIAIVLAVGFSAFTIAKQNEPTKALAGEKWFVFNGTAPDDLNDPSMYSLDGDGSSPTVCTSTTLTYRCEILAQPTGSPAEPILNTIIDERKRSTP
jgi:hypothetical protein